MAKPKYLLLSERMGNGETLEELADKAREIIGESERDQIWGEYHVKLEQLWDEYHIKLKSIRAEYLINYIQLYRDYEARLNL